MLSLTALDDVIEGAIEANKIVGAVVLVSHDGKLVYQRSAGFADREAGTPMREDCVFRFASVSKSIVSAAAMRLVEDGALSLYDNVSFWLPEFRPSGPAGTRPEITIRQLMTHTSGLSHTYLEPRDSPYQTAGLSDGLDGLDLTLEENMARLAALPLAFTPGTSWRYSLGIDVLGAVLTRVTGDALSNIVSNLVTRPLGMSQTRFMAAPGETLVTPYADGEPQPTRMRDGTKLVLTKSQIAALGGPNARIANYAKDVDGTVRFSPSRAYSTRAYASGGAGMIGTAHDTMRFLEAIRSGGTPILRSETVRTMTQNQVGAGIESQGAGWGFGYGWAVLSRATADTPQRPGTFQWGGAYGHNFFVDPQEKLVVVALTNTAFEGTSGTFASALRDAVYRG
ncbi:serine hydrolase domain-containing protein [Rhizobium sp. A37_96]